jgi:ABC-2 type transport system ATP-binding protein
MDAPVIEISNLTKFYGKTRGIEKLDLDVKKGEIFGFIGPNGAGKSTTIRILLNLIFPTSGKARILGMDAVKETKKIKLRTGYVPSDANAYGYMNVQEFMEYCLRFFPGGSATYERITELCERFELDTKRKISTLSLGNRKKVALVQSLLHRPELLILDEPTTGLDPLMQAKFFDLIREENQRGMTVFFSSHVLSEVQLLCKRVAVIKEGHIIQLEDIENLRKKQLKKVFVETRQPFLANDFTLKGIENFSPDSPCNCHFMYSGDINALVSFLQNLNLKNLTLEEPTLEEIFMHYYK